MAGHHVEKGSHLTAKQLFDLAIFTYYFKGNFQINVVIPFQIYDNTLLLIFQMLSACTDTDAEHSPDI